VHKYISLYYGQGKLLSEDVDMTTRKIIIMNNGQQVFAIKIKNPIYYCNILLYKTDHPRLHVGQIVPGQLSTFPMQQNEPLDISLASYVNSKFVYVEMHGRNQVTNLYRYVLKTNFELETGSNRISIYGICK